MNVFSIFKSFDGEANAFAGIGQPSVFIRFAGCNLRCKHCDTIYAQQVDQAKMGITPEDILKLISRFPGRKVTITGGEPLLQDWREFQRLLNLLVTQGRFCTIETNGSQPLDFKRHLDSVRYVVDYKLPSSGEEHKMRTQFFSLRDGFTSQDRVKFVIAGRQDFERAAAIVKMNVFGAGLSGEQFIFSSVYDLLSVRLLAEWLLDLGKEHSWAQDLALSFQAHKHFDWKEEK